MRVVSALVRRIIGKASTRRTRVSWGGPSVRPLTTLPALRDPPENVLRRLREVDPNVELVYIGLGVWVLGSVNQTRRRRDLAIKLLENERQRPTELQSMGRYRMARLMYQGFALIDMVDDSAVESGKVVRDFRFADWRYRHCAEEAFEENARGSEEDEDFERRKATLLDYVDSELPSVWSHVFKGRRSFTQRRLQAHRN